MKNGRKIDDMPRRKSIMRKLMRKMDGSGEDEINDVKEKYSWKPKKNVEQMK